jgi:uncharacterized protein YndB with AHSA1/START domain
MTESTEDTEAVVAVERVERFSVPPDGLWDAITDPDLLAEWFGPVEIDLVPGGAITGDEPGGTGTIGVVETVEPPRRIRFVWLAPGADSPSSVELVVDAEEGDGGGSVLHVRETLIRPHWETRPAWFTSTPRASASARV